MITVLVQFPLPGSLSVEAARQQFEQSAPRFQNVEGLVRKYYLLSEDGKTAGGVYLWKREELARQAHARFSADIKERFGVAPSVTYFKSPVIVDNITGKVESGA